MDVKRRAALGVFCVLMLAGTAPGASARPSPGSGNIIPSTLAEAPPPIVNYSWVFQTDAAIKYTHMSTIESLPGDALVAAFQASKVHEKADDQHLCFTVSHDGGATWAPHTVAMWGLLPVWGPVLHYDPSSDRLFLFYSESRKERSPGGDIKYVNTDLKFLRGGSAGPAWSAPTTIFTTEDSGGIQKVTANKVAVLPSGAWVLPYWQEGHDKVVDAGPPGAGVLVSHDAGATWQPEGGLLFDSSAKWLIENTVAPVGGGGGILQLFRTAEGRIWRSDSPDSGKTWSTPSLPNPNSKVFLMRAGAAGGGKGDRLVLAYNDDAHARSPLSLAQSLDGGSTWLPLAILETDPEGRFAYPTSVMHGDRVLTTYSVWEGPAAEGGIEGEEEGDLGRPGGNWEGVKGGKKKAAPPCRGIRLAAVRLPPVGAPWRG